MKARPTTHTQQRLDPASDPAPAHSFQLLITKKWFASFFDKDVVFFSGIFYVLHETLRQSPNPPAKDIFKISKAKQDE